MTRQFSRQAVAVGLIGAPVLTLAGAIAAPAIKSDSAQQLAVIADHSARYYVFTILTLAGIMLFVPATLGLMQMARDGGARWANAGGTLVLFGTLVAAGDAMTQLVIWQMPAPGADRAQMAALLDRYDSAAGSSVPFSLGGLAFVIGIALLAIGLRRARAVPTWVAIGLVAGIVLNIAGFSAASVGILIGSAVVLLASMGAVGWRVITDGADPRLAGAAAPATR